MIDLKTQKLKAIWLISLIFLFIGHKQEVLAEGEYLIVSIVDGKYPPIYIVNNRDDFTFISFEFKVRIENPTQSAIKVDFINSLIPFPCIDISLENESLVVTQALFIEWIAGSLYISPGTSNKTLESAFYIYHHLEANLPIGTYVFWFNYVNSCSVSVPVITEKIHIQVSETNVSYYFDYHNYTEIYPLPTSTDTVPTNQTNYFNSFSIISIYLAIITLNYNYIRKKIIF